MTTVQQHKRLIEGFVDGWNRHDSKTAEEVLAPTFVRHAPNLPPDESNGIEGFRRWFKRNHTANPDLRIKIDDFFAEGDKSVTRFTYNATNTGPNEGLGLAPSNNKVEFSGVITSRVENGKIAEQWVYADLVTLMQQVGAMPPPGQSTAR